MSISTEPQRPFAQRMRLWMMGALSLLALTSLTESSWSAGSDNKPAHVAATRSTNIALDASGSLLFAVNREANSLSIFGVQPKSGDLIKLDEVVVGQDPICVAVGDRRVYVTNGASGTVSVVARTGSGFAVVKDIPVGAEPRGCALAPDGQRLFVANYTEGTVAVISTQSEEVVERVPVGGNPYGLAITDQTVFVTQFFARLRTGGPGEGFDDGKEAVVQAFPVDNPGNVSTITLSPLADSGFTANRANFCTAFNATAPNQTFCPDTTITDPTNPVIAQDPQGVFPNQLKSVLACGGSLYLPNIGAQPEPPVVFNVNVQALVHVVDIASLSERSDLHVNLNAQIATEPEPSDPTTSLDHLFGNDLVAIDADPSCEHFFLVSRGGNFVLKAQVGQDGRLDIGAPDNVVRFQTGNIPTGIVVDRQGKKAYVNNEVNSSISILDLEANTVVARDVPSSTPAEPGSFDHARLLGRLVFFTALGVSDNGLIGTPIRDIIPLEFRGKQSRDAWSSCGSCHDDGLADSVTWIFGDGPRQTIPMDALYSKINGAHDTRINNWSAARDSVTDFNNNSRGVQGGVGFASDPPFSAAAPNPNIFDHGISQGGSEALDFETTWAQTIRTLNAPIPQGVDLSAGAAVFETNCASCHGGAKWTKSQVIYLNNPALDKAFAAGGTPRDPGLTMTANQVVEYADLKVDPNPILFLEDIGTFDAANPIEIRQNGQAPLGNLGFNVPSLLGVGSNAPYFHNGAAQSLEEVFAQHGLPPTGETIEQLLNVTDREDLLAFLRALDGRTPIFPSDTDKFRKPFEPTSAVANAVSAMEQP
jgi:YVTN family beta-propeller protein